MGHNFSPGIGPNTPSQLTDDEVIPTAIVIKNIPFNVKRETLLDIIVCLVTHWVLHFDAANSFFCRRHLSPSPRPTHSTITSINQASSVVLLLQTSARPLMQMLSLLHSMGLMFKAASCVLSTRKFCRLERKNVLSAKRRSGGCALCSWKKNTPR